jgi:hypothetical protein
MNIALDWQQSTALAAGLGVVAAGLYLAPSPRARRLAPFAREAGVIAVLYALWQLAGSLSVLGTGDAFRRAHDILGWERDLHLPRETSVQHLITGQPWLVQLCNLYYATMHFGALFAFLLWMFVRHRDQYARVRAVLVAVTASCLVVQFVPVAPPRLMPGFVDTAAQYGQSVYDLGLAGDEYSAMPSVHVAWAVLIAWGTLRYGAGRWRWIGPAHAVLTVFVVVATANHYWLDGIVATALLAACIAVQSAVLALWRRRGQDADVRADREHLSPEVAR